MKNSGRDVFPPRHQACDILALDIVKITTLDRPYKEQPGTGADAEREQNQDDR